MNDTVIKVENVGKLYRLGEIGTGTISHDLNRWLARVRGKEDPFAKVGETNDRTAKGSSDYVWALQNVDFDVKQGEVLGIVGRNGAGKSTLLKILSKVTTPSTGQIKIRGRIASLLEVGTGFHPDLTGRENIFLNGAILGMSKDEIRKKFDEIVDFAGVERYIDTPVKRYSSGMYVRLAFAVAAFLEPEILIVDEVLAVGDVEFQKKCIGRMKDVSVNDGRTVLFVSHNMGALRSLCTKAILMNHGRVEQEGSVNTVIAKYLTNPLGIFSENLINKQDLIQIRNVAFKNVAGIGTQNFSTAEDMIVEIQYTARERYENPFFWVGVKSQFGSLFGASMLLDGKRPAFVEGEGKIACRFKKLPLLPQTYTVTMGIRASNGREILTQTKEVGTFNITNNISELDAVKGDYADIIADNASPVMINYEWQMPDGKIIPVNLIN